VSRARFSYTWVGMTTAEKYVTAAYLVVFASVLLYVVIIAAKLARLEREVGELAELARARHEAEAEPRAELPVA
jgi:CcmD family protein